MEDSKYGKHGEEAALYGAYKKSLELCKENDLHSVVFPLISAGIFGYPLQGDWTQAAAACKDFFQTNPDFSIDITFAIPELEKLTEGEKVFSNELAQWFKSGKGI